MDKSQHGNAKASKAGKAGGKSAVWGSRKRENIGNRNQMRDLLSKAREGASSLFTESMSKRIEFSNSSLRVYDGHTTLINDIFLNPEINTFISYNDKSLHSWDPETGEVVSQINFNDAEAATIQSISCLCYSPKYHLYFACSKDFKLIVFNEHLNMVHWQRMPVNLVQVMVFYEAGCQLLVGGKEGCFIIDLEITFKYDPRMAILLDPKGQSITVRIKKVMEGADGAGAEGAGEYAATRGITGAEGQVAGEAKGPNLAARHAQMQREDHTPKGGDAADGSSPNVANTKVESTAQNDNMPVNCSDQNRPERYWREYGPHIKQLQGVTEWVKGLKVFEKENLIVVWKKEILTANAGTSAAQSEEASRSCKIKCTRDQIIFYALATRGQYQQGEVWSRYYDSSIREDFITDILVCKEQKSFITGHNLGDIHLRKLVELKNMDPEAAETGGGNKDEGSSANQATEKALIQAALSIGSKSVHVFKGHSRTVTSLAPVRSRDATSFVSASLDGKVRIWCLEKMIELYCFDIAMDSPVQNFAMADSIMNVKLINDKIYAMIFKSFIEIGLISHLASSYYISKQSIGSIGKCYLSSQDRHTNNPNALFISFNDNSIVLLNPHDQQPSVSSTIYPPPTPAEVIKVFYCTSIRRVFLLLATGAICVYQIEKETGTLEKLQESKSLKDYEGKSMNQGITCITTAYTGPPQYDCEIFSDLYKYREPVDPDYQFIQDPYDDDEGNIDQFLVIGLSKGTILFVKVNNMDHIYARFSIHRQAVEQIHEIRQHKVFLSICEKHILNIWGFEQGKEQVYQHVNLCREVMTIVVPEPKPKALRGEQECHQSQQLLMCFQSGDSEILVWNNELKQLNTLKVDKSDEHEDAITCCDSLPSLGLFVSGDNDGLVKIWNCKKQLIREIQFVEPVNSVAFLNERGDIIVGHSRNLSRLNSEGYMDKKMLVSEADFQKWLAGEAGQKEATDEWFKEISQKGVQSSDAQNTARESGDHGDAAQNNASAKDAELAGKFQQSSAKPAEGQKLRDKPKQQSGMKKQQQLNPTPTYSAQASTQQHQPAPATQHQPLIVNVSPQAAGAAGGTNYPPATGPHINIQTYDPNTSQSNTGSQMNSTIKATHLRNQLADLRAECVKVPSVSQGFMKNRKKIQNKEKQALRMKNSTRRMMTEQRIQRNIGKNNDPSAANRFHDVLVSQAASQGNILYAYRQDIQSGQSEHGVQTSKYSRGHPLSKSTYYPQDSKGFKKDGVQPAFERSYFSNFDSQMQKKDAYGFRGEKISQMQVALQQMAQSANTFSIFDNNSFDGFRVQNHRLNTVAKNQKLEQNFMNQLSQNQQPQIDSTFQSGMKEEQQQDQANETADADTGSKDKKVSQDQPQPHHHYVATVKMNQNSPDMQLSKQLRNSEEFNLKEDLKDNQLAPTSSPFFRNANHQMKLANSTLQKSQASTVARHAEGATDKRGSPLRGADPLEDTPLPKDDIKIAGFHAQQKSNKLDSSQGNSPIHMSMQNQKAKLHTESNQAKPEAGVLNKGSTETSLEHYNSAQNQGQYPAFKIREAHEEEANELGKQGAHKASSLIDDQQRQKEDSQVTPNAKEDNQADQGSLQQKGEVDLVLPAKQGAEEAPLAETLNGYKRGDQEDEFLIQNDEDPTREDLDDDDDGLMAKATKQNAGDGQQDEKDGGEGPVMSQDANKSRFSLIKRQVQVLPAGPRPINESQDLSAGTMTGGLAAAAQTKYSTAVVQLDAANSQMSQPQFDMSEGPYEPIVQSFQQKQYSQKIRGSTRAQGANQFVSTRLQQRNSKLHPIQPHLISNAKVKTDFNKILVNSSNGMILQTTGQDFPRRGRVPATNEAWSPITAPQPNKVSKQAYHDNAVQAMQKNQFREQSPNLSQNLHKRRAMKSMGTGAVTGGLGPAADLPQDSNERLVQSNKPQLFQDEGKEGAVSSGKQIAYKSNIASQRTGLQSGGGNPRNEAGSASPQSKANRHQRLAEELMLGNEHVQYGLASDQTTHRMGGIITSSQPAAGNPVYLRNAIAQGAHMPSKGVYNYQQMTQRPYQLYQKPQTAGAYTKRPKRGQSLANMEQRHKGSVGAMGAPADPQSVYLSTYRQNMNNIQMLSNLARVNRDYHNYQPRRPLDYAGAASLAKRNITSAGVVIQQAK